MCEKIYIVLLSVLEKTFVSEYAAIKLLEKLQRENPKAVVMLRHENELAHDPLLQDVKVVSDRIKVDVDNYVVYYHVYEEI